MKEVRLSRLAAYKMSDADILDYLQGKGIDTEKPFEMMEDEFMFKYTQQEETYDV